MEDYEFIIVDRKEPVLIVTINRPEKLNALLPKSWEEIMDVVEKLRRDRAIKYVIFTGAGENFTSGDDAIAVLKRHAEIAPGEQRYEQQIYHENAAKIANLEQVTIAAIRGICFGAGLGLSMLCDFRIAALSARIGIPEMKVGVFFSWGGTYLLNRLVGPQVAKDMIMAGRVFEGEQAERIGLVNYIVPDDQLMDRVYELIDVLEGHAPNALRLAKKMINASTALQRMGDLFTLEPEFFSYQMMSGEPAEGAQAFLEKRKPKWR